MKLRKKVLFILGLGIVGLSTSFYVASRLLLLRSYATLEQAQVQQDVQRVVDAISNETTTLARQAFDYAHWDDTYEFIQDGNSTYIESNFANFYISELGLNAIVYVNNLAEIVYAEGADLVNEKTVPVSSPLLAQLTLDSPLLNEPDGETGLSGILKLPEGAMLVSSQAIVTSEGEGPIRGNLVMAYYLDDRFIQKLEDLTSLPNLTIEPFDSEQLPPDFEAAKQRLVADNLTAVVEPLDSENIAGYALLRDISGQPALLLRVTEPRSIYAQGQSSLNYLVLAIVITGSVFSVIVLLFLERSILSRLSRLSAVVKRIGSQNSLTERVALIGSDELSDLAKTFNATLDQLEQSQTALQTSAKRLQQHNQILSELSHHEALIQGDAHRAAHTFVEVAATTLAVDRVSIWLYSLNQTQLTCLDLYDRMSDRHVTGMEFSQAVFPQYFETLAQDEIIAATDAYVDARTQDLAELYLQPQQVRALMDVPIQVAGRRVGIIRCEQLRQPRSWRPEERTLIYALASLLALALESETLQGEVGHILEVVSSVEAGDLTVQAQVSERATGLVADTLNRLIEELAQVMAQVFGTAQQVFDGASALDAIAKTVATHAGQQADSVTQVLEQTQQVKQAAIDSATQGQTTREALLKMQTAIEQGRSEITALTQGIEVLQQGSDRIVQHMKALGEFVGLADQFVYEQNEIASMTQILAMNAELVAARAAAQRDPRQFVFVAREFDAIAAQVSTLAQQTNAGLASLEKRTAQIHTVVSAIDADVQKLGGLVNGFTIGVEQSSQVFNHVRAVTGEMDHVMEVVSASSHEIVNAAQSTAQAMQSIANLASRTAQLTQTVRSQSEAMDARSAQLLRRIQFFRMPEAMLHSQAQSPHLLLAAGLAPEDEPLPADSAQETAATESHAVDALS